MKKGILVIFVIVCFAGLSVGQDQQQSKKGSQLAPELARGDAPKIMGYDVAPTSIDRTELELDLKGYPTNASLGYKGIVMANLHNDTTDDEIAVDFGSLGLYIYDSGVWHQISSVNPERMISATLGSASDDELIVDFGSIGVWRWDYGPYPGYWAQWTGVSPTGMFATDDDDDDIDAIYFDFGTLGAYRYKEGQGWAQLSNLNPYNGLRMDYYVPGWQEGVFCFPTYGVWNIYWTSGPYYDQLTGTVTSNDDHASAQFTNTSGAEDLIVDFGSLGLWLYKGDGSGWVQFSTMDPNRIKEVKFMGVSDYELLVEENGGGLYWVNWNGSGGTPTLISNNDIGPGGAWCETFDETGTDSGDEEVIIPWTAGGASIYDYSAGGTLTPVINTAYFINFVVKGDYYNRGYDSTLVFVFGGSSPVTGVWMWEPNTNNQGWISYNLPDGAY